ncbi:MAG: hypothetical protein ACFBSE_04935 [Prochloraceae cyanobacterium]
MKFNQDDKDDRNEDRYLDIREEIMLGRQFSLADLIAKEGGSFLKGESPVPKLVQTTTEINNFIDRNLVDTSGALQAVLYKHVKNDLRVSQHLDSPLIALNKIIRTLIDNQTIFYEFVKEVDLEWGRIFDERPYFQQPGEPPHPEDEYTHESVRLKLLELLELVKSEE